MKKFRNKYRIPSARLPGWDYRLAGAYFITICTQNRTPFFGECQGGKMKLSTAGMIAQGCWYQIPFLKSHVTLGAFVVMPNHVHGIMILDEMENDGVGVGDGDGGGVGGGVETFESNVSTSNNPKSNVYTPNQTPNANPDYYRNNKTNSVDVSVNNKNPFFQNISPKSGSVSRIIQHYKTACTKHIRSACPEIDFEWQTRFYDHIIRNEVSFATISNYILNNPEKWKEDRFNASTL
jgi:REP element-mobilizing transposase RayT